VTRREKLARLGAALAGLVCLVLAVAAGAFAVDLARWDGAIADDDVRFRSTTEARWVPSTVYPERTSRAVLGVDDDLELRRAIRAVRLARLDDRVISDPTLALARNEAQARLEAIASGTGDSSRRSRAAGLLGVLALAQLATETQERDALLEYAISSLQRAIALDPDNAEAKLNLELALQRGRSLQLEESGGGKNPSPGGSGSRGAGAGEAGSGY
jgi:hypothetical protein